MRIGGKSVRGPWRAAQTGLRAQLKPPPNCRHGAGGEVASHQMHADHEPGPPAASERFERAQRSRRDRAGSSTRARSLAIITLSTLYSNAIDMHALVTCQISERWRLARLLRPE